MIKAKKTIRAEIAKMSKTKRPTKKMVSTAKKAGKESGGVMSRGKR